jgi:hypothetical protein
MSSYSGQADTVIVRPVSNHRAVCAQDPCLAATRSREVRVFKKLETVVGYLMDIGIHGFHVDTSNFDPQNVGTYSRPDASAALKRAHAAAAHDK